MSHTGSFFATYSNWNASEIFNPPVIPVKKKIKRISLLHTMLESISLFILKNATNADLKKKKRIKDKSVMVCQYSCELQFPDPPSYVYNISKFETHL